MSKMSEDIEKLQDLSRRFSGLMADPEPGIGAWAVVLGRTLDEIAAFAPSATRNESEEKP